MNVDSVFALVHVRNMKLGKELEAAIKNLGISQAQFAKETGLAVNTIRLLIANEIRFPSPRVVDSVSGVLSLACPHCGQLQAPVKARRPSRKKR
jgi:transcriptional regulator with XRE-family HTH domain